MEEISSILDQIEAKLPDSSPKKLKVRLVRAAIAASFDVAAAIKRQDFEAVEERIKRLQDEHVNIRSSFAAKKFPSGGIISKPRADDLEYWQNLAKAALAYIEQISTNAELNTQEKRERLDSWKELQIIKSKQYCTCEAPIVRFDGEEYCGYCQKVIL